MGGRWCYKLIVSLNIQSVSYKDKQTNHGWTLGLQTHCKDTGIMGGRWRNKLIVSLKYIQFYTTKIQKLWVDVGDTNLHIVSLKYTKFTLQRCTKYGWTLALQSYSVSTVCIYIYIYLYVYIYIYIHIQRYATKRHKLWVDVGVTDV